MKRKYYHNIAIIAAIIVGLTLLVSGTGKVPGQTEFTWALMKSFWTPALAHIIGNYLPWLEIVLGVLLILGILPKITAVSFLPLAGGFMANNIWTLMQGIEEFPECGSCFGIWEEMLGSLSPLGALIMDIILVCLALVVIFLNQGKFLNLRPWFIK